MISHRPTLGLDKRPLLGCDPTAHGATIDVTRRRVRLRQDPSDGVYELRPDGSILRVVRLPARSGDTDEIELGHLERGNRGWRPAGRSQLRDTREVLRLVARAWNKAPLLREL